MGWGVPRRPKIGHGKITYPEPREGSDGDIQVRQTNLGAKLFGKVGGRWYGAPLTGTAGDPVTRIGTNLSDHLAIDRDSVDIFTGGSKVASFGATTTVADINLTGKITLDSEGDRNICIGTSNVDTGDDNVSVGVAAGASLNDSSVQNTLVGSKAGEDITSGIYNVCVGYNSGNNQATGAGGLYLGNNAIASGSNIGAEGVIHSGVGLTGLGNNTMILGPKLVSNGTIYNIGNTTAWDQTSDVRFKTNIVDIQDNALSLINQIKVRNFNWKEEGDLPVVNGKPYNAHDPDKLRIGIIAQELEEILPQCIGEDGHGYKSFNGSDVHFLLIKAIQELSAKVDTMQTEINNLKEG